jgi:hypothetical protein
MLSEQVNEALQSLKEAKTEALREGKSLLNQKKQERALRSLIYPQKYDNNIKSISYGGLLMRVFNELIRRAKLTQEERDNLISATWFNIYKDVDRMHVDSHGRIDQGLGYVKKIFINQIKSYQKREITARGDWHEPNEKKRAKVKDLSIKGHTYRYIGYELRASYDVLIKNYKAELAFGKEDNAEKEVKRTEYYVFESRKVSAVQKRNDYEGDVEDWEPDTFLSGENDAEEVVEEKPEPIEFVAKEDNKNIVTHELPSKSLEECVNRGFELFEAKEFDRALVISLKHTDFYDNHQSFLKKAWEKFGVSKKTISEADNRKLSSKEIGEIIGKTAANVDVYFNESKKKFQEYIKHCRKFLKQNGKV